MPEMLFRKIVSAVNDKGRIIYNSRGMTESSLAYENVKAVSNVSEFRSGTITQIKVTHDNKLVYRASSTDFKSIDVKTYSEGLWENEFYGQIAD